MYVPSCQRKYPGVTNEDNEKYMQITDPSNPFLSLSKQPSRLA